MEFFKIVQKQGKERKVVHHCVYLVDEINDAWVFMRSFYSEEKAREHIAYLKKELEKGHGECLSLKNSWNVCW